MNSHDSIRSELNWNWNWSPSGTNSRSPAGTLILAGAISCGFLGAACSSLSRAG